MTYPQAAKELSQLREQIPSFKDPGVAIIAAANGNICGSCEFFFIGILKRTAAFTQAFCDALDANNHYVAPSLIRPNLENLLALHAAEENANGVHAFTFEQLQGTQFRDMKSKSGDKLTLNWLAKSLDTQLVIAPGSGDTKGLYKWANKFVHFNSIFLYSSFIRTNEGEKRQALVTEDGRFQMKLWDNDLQFTIPQVSEKDIINWIVAMVSINRLILTRLEQIARIKDRLGLACRRLAV